MFTAAFQSGQLGPLISQFNLGAEATEAANRGGKSSIFTAKVDGTSCLVTFQTFPCNVTCYPHVLLLQ